jgi:DNA-binding response OmpR family regulator
MKGSGMKGHREKKEILIKSNDKSLREGLYSALLTMGYDTYFAVNGSNALEVTVNRVPDLMVVDQSLNLKDAEQFVHLIRSNPMTKNIPILGFFREGEGESDARGRAAGIMWIPTDMEKLIANINRLLDREKKEALPGKMPAQARAGLEGPAKIVDLEFVQVTRVYPEQQHTFDRDFPTEETKTPPVPNSHSAESGKQSPHPGNPKVKRGPIPNREREVIEEPKTRVPVHVTGRYPAKLLASEMEMEMIGLYQSVDSLLSSCKGKVIQFIGSLEGEGVSTMTREFAKVSATKFERSVLLMDADYRNPTQHRYFDILPEYGLEEVIRNGQDIDQAIHRVGNSRLHLNLISTNGHFTLRVFNSPLVDTLLKSIRFPGEPHHFVTGGRGRARHGSGKYPLDGRRECEEQDHKKRGKGARHRDQ